MLLYELKFRLHVPDTMPDDVRQQVEGAQLDMVKYGLADKCTVVIIN